MIKCFFVNVKSIFCDVPRSNFIESELEQLADFILETDGLIRPLILKEIGVQQYAIIRGHREYYGAVIAKERDLKKAEMVNAFIIEPKIQEVAIEQLRLLSEERESSFDKTIYMDTKEQDIDRLLPALASMLSHQLQPLTEQLSNVVSQLAEHKEMLALLTRDSPVAIPKVLKEEEVIKRSVAEVVTSPELIKSLLVAPPQVIEIIKQVTIPPTKVKGKEKISTNFSSWIGNCSRSN